MKKYKVLIIQNNGLYTNNMSVFYNPIYENGDGTFETEEEAINFCNSIDEISEFAIVPVYIK
mgnify:FL=1|tara:strand:- start:169 stop:354 length:186 start_codon:yes stop_codon:yes gene_type:complete